MSVQELKERYVYAVSRLLPHKIREDISAELDTLIEDMLEERCQDRPAEEKDLRVVLRNWAPLPKWRTITVRIRINALSAPLISAPTSMCCG